MVPLQGFRMENRHGNNCENRKGNGFLDDLKLHQAEGTSVDATADGVGGNHETVFQKGHTPAGENNKNQRPIGADMHFLEF